MDGLAELWLKLLNGRDSNVKEIRKAKVELLRKLPEPFYKGEPAASLTRDSLEHLLQPFRNKLPARHYYFVVLFLYKGLKQGHETLGWGGALPAVPAKVSREPSRFKPELFSELPKLRRIERLFIENLLKSDLSPTARYGQLLLSAVLFGGLLDSKWFMPWLTALRSGIKCSGKLYWLDMIRFWQHAHDASDDVDGNRKRSVEPPITMLRRWHADPITLCLIMKWHSLPEKEREVTTKLPNPLDIVREFLIACGHHRQELPASVTALIKLAKTRLSLVITPFLVSHATNEFTSVSLPPETWARLYTGKAVPATRKGSEEDKATTRRINLPVASGGSDSRYHDQEALLKKLKAAVGEENIKPAAALKKLKQLVETYGQGMSVIVILLYQWAYGIIWRQKRAPSTASRYLSAVAKYLLVVCHDDDPLEFMPLEYTDRYNRALSLINSKTEVGYARSTMGRFHNFLMVHHGAPVLDQSFFQRRSGPPETTVDANLLSQNDFEQLKLALRWDEADRPRLASAALVAAILGFRCGLRSDEVYYLRVCDIQGRRYPELLVRAHAARSLKTEGSTRRVPLHILAPDDELQFVKSWVTSLEHLGHDTLLFCRDGLLPRELIPESLLLRPIREALNLVTGDRRLRFHHFRHSFATWLLIRLTGNPRGLRSLAPFLDHPEFSDERVAKLRNTLLGNEALGRKGAYTVAALCGHADLDTAFTSYIHLCDLLLGNELSDSNAFPTINAETVMALLDLTQATAYRGMNKQACFNGDRSWDWAHLFSCKREFNRTHRDPVASQAREVDSIKISFSVPELPLWQRAQKALTLHQLSRCELADICQETSLDMDVIVKFIERAEHYSTMRNKPFTQTVRSYRHVEYINFSLRTDRLHKPVRKGIFPHPLHLKIDTELATKILGQFERLDGGQKRLVFDMVDDFIEKFSHQSGMLYFSEATWARRFLDAHRLLGIKDSMFRLIDCQQNEFSGNAPEVRRKWWEQQLRLKKPLWGTRDKRWGRKTGYGTIGIQVVHDVAGKIQAAYGLRYALYMIAIVYWD